MTPRHRRVALLPLSQVSASSSPLRSPPLIRQAQCTWRLFVCFSRSQSKSRSKSPSGQPSQPASLSTDTSAGDLAASFFGSRDNVFFERGAICEVCTGRCCSTRSDDGIDFDDDGAASG